MCLHKTNSGFTLIELMIVLILLSIVATVAVPGFNQLIENNRQTTLTNSFLGLLHYARTEAVRRGEPIEVTPSGGSFVVSAFPGGTKTTIREMEALPGSASIARTDGGGSDLEFSPTGRSNVAAAGAFTYRICGAPGSDGVVIRVNRGGQINTNPGTVTCPP